MSSRKRPHSNRRCIVMYVDVSNFRLHFFCSLSLLVCFCIFLRVVSAGYVVATEKTLNFYKYNTALYKISTNHYCSVHFHLLSFDLYE